MKGVYVASSVQDLAQIAEDSLPPIDNGTKLIAYFRSAQQVLMQVCDIFIIILFFILLTFVKANIYKNEGGTLEHIIYILISLN